MRYIRSLFSASVNVIIPSLIMSFMSDENLLGPHYAFLIALLLPLSYGIYYLSVEKRYSVFSIIGLISILLTGGFGFMELSHGWMISKETAIPAVIGVVILLTGYMKRPFISVILDEVLDMESVKKDYKKKGKEKMLSRHIDQANTLFSIIFFIGAILNLVLSLTLLASDPGTPEYASEVGRLAALSFPAIVLPIIILLTIVFAILAGNIEKSTGNDIMDYMGQKKEGR